MLNVYVYCEGQTEESFVNSCLLAHFFPKNINLVPIICRTKEGPNGIYKGGLTDYNKAVKEIKKLCSGHSNEIVTSFIDYYGLKNIPKVECSPNNKYQTIAAIEQKFLEDVSHSNFVPYLSLHEFESLLFSDPSQFRDLDENAAAVFENTLKEFENNPELINGGQETAPSKRILEEINNYSKIRNGIQIAKNISLQSMRDKCKHFDRWITKLEMLNN